MFKSCFLAILKVQTLFTAVFAPHKHTGVDRLRIKTMCKKLIFWGFIYSVKITRTRFDVYETLCPQQMLVHECGQIKNWSGECRDVIPTKVQCQTIQRALQSPNLQREIIKKKIK